MATRTQTEVVMPQMGVSVSEGTVTKWLKQVGDHVALDEPLLEISTDKVDTEVPSPGEGIVSQILVEEGATVDVGTILALITPEGAISATPESEPVAPVTEASPPTTPESVPAPRAAPEPQPPRVDPQPEAGDNGKTFVSPVVARIAAEHGVDPGRVPGTGAGGRVTKKDILAFIASDESMKATEPARPEAHLEEPAAPVVPEPQRAAPAPAPTPEPVAAVAPPPEAPKAPVSPQPVAADRLTDVPLIAGESVEPMTAMRRGVMEHMRRSLDTSAHVTSAIEVDMSKVVAARERVKAEYQTTYGVNPTYLSFIALATVETLRDYPWVNAEIRGESIVTRQFVNLGIAVALANGKGLIVPVIKHAEDLNLLGMARQIADIAERARTKKLLPDDVQGGTFTITNPGGFGTFHGTPIISQPQVGILGTYALVKRPWVVQDELGNDVIAIRPIMNITLTYDHRLVDGAYSGQFLRDLRERLESWED